MYRRLGSKHLFQKIGRLFFFTRMRPGQNDRKHPLLVLLSVLCKSLQRPLIFIALHFSAYALFGKAGAKVRRFLIPSKCFERKVCESWQFFALFDKTKVKRECFGGKAGKRGYSGSTILLSWRRPGKQNWAISWENEALEGRNKGRRTEEMGRDGRKQEPLTTGKLFSPYYIYSAGKAKVDVAGKSTPSCPLGGGQKPIVHPSGWSRGGFGTESRTRTSKFLMQVRQQDHRTRIGSKVG